MAANHRDPEKTVDVPPTGSRNPDPITDAPGSHPVETGIGAAVAGAASGLAVGAVAGPVGAALGAAAGAIAGGYAGKGIGELIDPTTEDNWLRESFSDRPYVREGDTFDTYRPAYRYGSEAEARYSTDNRGFTDVETDLRTDWEREHASTTGMAWDQARGAVQDSYDRTRELRALRKPR